MRSLGTLIRRLRRSGELRALQGSNRQSFLKRTVIIGIHAGGLGDHLAYSGLPRLYKGIGATRVLISRLTNYGEPLARNPEVADYVWSSNPYVDGFTDERPNVGEIDWPPTAFFKAAKHSESPIDTVAEVHGLAVFAEDGKTRLLPPRPDLFYRPKQREDFADQVVCDPYSISQPFSPAVFNTFAAFVSDWHNIDVDNIIILCNSHSQNIDPNFLPNNVRYSVKDISEYTDIIASARAFLTTESGGQSVAAAVRQSGAFVLMTSRAYNERHFIWPNNKYFVTGEMTQKEAEWPMLSSLST